jgi:hypothetical protein
MKSSLYVLISVVVWYSNAVMVLSLVAKQGGNIIPTDVLNKYFTNSSYEY